MAMIQGKDYPTPTRIGETVSYKHHKCPASGGKEDSKERLYITLKDRRIAVWYCQHCTSKGKLRIGYSDSKVDPVVRKSKDLPSDYTYSLPQHARLWLEKYHIDTGVAQAYRIGYSDYKQAPVGHILRLTGEAASTRYLSMLGDRKCLYGFKKGSSKCFIVEDWISCIRIAELGYSCICLLGTSLGKAQLLELVSTHYEEYVIWLDNDSKLVRQLARKIYNDLVVFGKEAVLKTASEEPKHFTNVSLSSMIQTGSNNI
jgi:hypothetical protein